MKRVWCLKIALNDELIGEIEFRDEESKDIFMEHYKKLMGKDKPIKWGFALFEFEESEINQEKH